MREAAWLEPEEDFRDSAEYDRAVCAERDRILTDDAELSEMIANGFDPTHEMAAMFRAIESATSGNAAALTEVTAAAWKLFTRAKTIATEQAERHYEDRAEDFA